ncbi:MAG: hypothetical protein Fur0034_09370 [Desulfuromonadia bacterium]
MTAKTIWIYYDHAVNKKIFMRGHVMESLDTIKFGLGFAAVFLGVIFAAFCLYIKIFTKE